jgi:hypothetical protein
MPTALASRLFALGRGGSDATSATLLCPQQGRVQFPSAGQDRVAPAQQREAAHCFDLLPNYGQRLSLHHMQSNAPKVMPGQRREGEGTRERGIAAFSSC